MPGNGYISGVFYIGLKCKTCGGNLREFCGARPWCSASSDCTEVFHANILQIKIFFDK